MREIKFRAWDKKRNKFVSDFNLSPKGNILCEHSNLGYKGVFEVDLELMQYTGLKDKNGKEIYEGDIVKMLADSLNGEENIEVKWRKEGFWEYFNGFDNCEVIGNIYENTELLKS